MYNTKFDLGSVELNIQWRQTLKFKNISVGFCVCLNPAHDHSFRTNIPNMAIEVKLWSILDQLFQSWSFLWLYKSVFLKVGHMAPHGTTGEWWKTGGPQ
jgi:hypothetical protein